MSGGARYALDGIETVTVGRGERREGTRPEGAARRLQIRIPNSFVSTHHAELQFVGATWVIRDCGSTNGTFVNGRRITSHPLADGDLIEIGHCFFVFSMAVPTPAGFGMNEDLAAMGGDCVFTTLLPALRHEFQRLQTASPTRLTILLTGEMGTGKELVARAVHALSGRTGEFVAVNCAALAPTLVESLLFGHARGAFSGAVRDEPGLLRASQRGTLFLDEIAELPPKVQAMLLRAIQEGEVTPVGSSRPVAVDLRLIAASQTPLSELVQKGGFRADLHARLNGFELRLPSFFERRVDIGLILRSLLVRMDSRSVRLSRRASEALCVYSWPQNIRELEHALQHACAFRTGSMIGLCDLPASLAREGMTRGHGSPSTPPVAQASLMPAAIQRCLDEHGGSIEQAWRALGLKNRFALIRLVKKHRLKTAARTRS
jgi:DNA-binding NtrC family response regulator